MTRCLAALALFCVTAGAAAALTTPAEWLAHVEDDLVGRAPDGKEAVRMAGQLRPDIVLTAAALPGLDGATVTRLVRALGAGQEQVLFVLLDFQ